jgi:hypothetical protein
MFTRKHLVFTEILYLNNIIDNFDEFKNAAFLLEIISG